jgi:general secretion pathway protein A
MYLDFYRLQKAPFHITPDPEFLFLSPSHKAALGAIIYGIEERQGFVAITGEVGLGKTTILRSYLERIDAQQLRTIYIFNANLSFRSLLKIIFQEFGLDLEDLIFFEDEDLFELVNRLHQALIQEYKRGRNVALIIDEAQNMPVETLENLRMLSNLETSTEKLVQIVLIGQPEFERKLELHELRQLKQRLVIHARIEPLTPEESLAYIQHRLDKVARSPQALLTKGALKLIVEAAQGTPRALNILCTNTLIAGFGYRQNPIPAETVREVIVAQAGKKPRSRLRAAVLWPAAALAGAGLFLASPYGQQALSHVPQQLPSWPDVLEKIRLSATGPVAPVPPLPLPPQPVAGNEPGTAEPQRISLGQPLAQPEGPPEPGKDNGHTAPEPSSPLVPPAPLTLPGVKMTEPPTVRTIAKGESVSKIVAEVYGVATDAALEIVKKHNPHILDINKVAVGTKIILPKSLTAEDGAR